MKKLFAVFLLAWSGLSIAQTFPVQNLVVNGTATVVASTTHSLIVGEGSSPVTFVGPGTAGYALLSNGASADPSFQLLQSSALSFLQAGTGAVSRTLQAKVQEISVNVNDYGADPTGLTDSTTAIQEAVNQVAALGGGYVNFSAGTYIVSTTLSISTIGVKLRGVGHDTNHDSGSPAPVTTLKWNGASGGTMIDISPPTAPTQRLANNGVTGMYLSSNSGLAAIGLDLYSSNWGVYDFAGDMFTTALMRMAPDAALTAEASDPQFNIVSLDHRNLANSGSMLILNGTTNNNTSFDYFPKLHSVLLGSSHAILLNNADNDVFESVVIFGSGSATGTSVTFGAGTGSQFARANTFEHLSTNVQVYAQGTEIAAVPSANNHILFWDVENSAINIVQGTSATIYVGSNHAPTGYRTYASNVGGTSSYQDEDGRIIASGFTGTIGTNSNLAITLPIPFLSGAVNVSVTPNGGSPTTFSAECSTTTLTIFNGSQAASSFFWRVEGR
jgi:hypothetical protein